MAALGMPVAVGCVILAPQIIHITRVPFDQSIPSLRILGLAIVFLFANSAFTAMLYAIDRQNLFAWTTAIAVVVNVALNLILIPFYGYLAASAVTVVTEAAFSVAGWYFVGRTARLAWLRVSWRILLAGLLMGAVLYPISNRSLLLSAPVGLAAYAGLLWAMGAVRREELDMVLRGFGLGRPPSRT